MGMAIDKRLITTVHARVAGLLPLAAPIKLDPRTERVEIEHLLTMRSGFQCGVEVGEKELAQMRQSDDWAAFALALPMLADPGTEYAYCSCNSHLLSAIISAHASESALAFARKYLFEPLGIRDVRPRDR
jgi:CubicO group peptidase (beta-lactamase class C family)